MVPLGLQAFWQVPLAQVPEQQSENARQAPPLAVQLTAPQLPWVLHAPEQQGWVGEHASPFGVQVTGPQTSPLQLPLQQGWVALHVAPLGRHAAAPHTLSLHCAEQQSVAVMHGPPSGRQTLAPQRPMLLQLPVQHLASAEQACPSGMHIDAWQVPAAQTSPAQQPGKPALQSAPIGWQTPPQTPLVQALEQHCVGSVQASPSGMHAQTSPQMTGTWATQTASHALSQQKGSFWQISSLQGLHDAASGAPAVQSPCEHVVTGPHWSLGLQRPLQQGWSGLHAAPSGRHVVPPHTPLAHALVQQGVVDEQAVPSGRQAGAPQTPPTPQVPLQQSVETLQAAPSGWQAGFSEQVPPSQLWVQQSDPTLHAAPMGEQGPPHTAWLHTPSQQSAAATQLAPAGVQVPLSVPPVPPEPPVLDPSRMLLRPQLAITRGPPRNVASNAKSQR
jgi:hypothetical protein